MALHFNPRLHKNRSSCTKTAGFFPNLEFPLLKYTAVVGYYMVMPHRSSKKRLPDPTSTQMPIVLVATGETTVPNPDLPQAIGITSEKNPAAVALGRLGGLKGGPARAKKLDKKARSEIAKKAALTRWRNKDGESQEESQKPTDTPKM